MYPIISFLLKRNKIVCIIQDTTPTTHEEPVYTYPGPIFEKVKAHVSTYILCDIVYVCDSTKRLESLSRSLIDVFHGSHRA